MNNKGAARKVIVLGLDGASWSAFDVMRSKGVMPHMERLINKGITGTLFSTVPPYTPVAWTTFATGMNPGKHGVFDFFCRKKDGSYGHIDSSTIKAPCFWNILSHFDRQTAVINFPISYPVEQVNGYMISGFLTPSGKKDISYPEDFINEIEKDTGPYIINVSTHALKDYSKGSVSAYIEKLLNMTKCREKVLDHFLNKERVDCLFILFMMLDKLHHKFYKYLMEPDADRWIFEKISECYACIDSILGKVLDFIDQDPEYGCIVMSDHGFSPYQYTFDINKVMYANGYVKIKWLNFFLTKIRGFIRRNFLPRSSGLQLHREHFIHPDSQCFMPPNVRDKLRADRSTHKAQKGLLELKDNLLNIIRGLEKEYDTKLIKSLYLSKELYHGPFTGRTEDIVIEPEDGVLLVPGISVRRLRSCVFRENVPEGVHTRQGVFGLYTSGIQAKGEKLDLNMADILPNMLAFMGVPVSREMDGDMLYKGFGLTEKDVEFTETYEGLERNVLSADLSREDKKDIEKQLEDLGYL